MSETSPKCWPALRRRCNTTIFRDMPEKTARTFCWIHWRVRVAGHRGEETEQLAAWPLAWRNHPRAASSAATGCRSPARRSERLSCHRGHHVRRPPLDADPRDAGSDSAGFGDRRARRPVGRDLLVAIAAGCEVTTRVGLGVDLPDLPRQGLARPGRARSVGAAAAVGRLRRFDTETMAKAFGLAGSQAAGTFAAWGTPTVKFHQCRGALSGLMAALLAEQKFLATANF